MPDRRRKSSASRAHAVWSLLSRPVEHTPEIDPSVRLSPGQRYHLLDILVARLLSLLLPQHGWTVTSNTRHRGAEMQGEEVLFDIPEFDVHGRELVLCASTPISLQADLGDLTSITLDVLTRGEPAHFILAIPAMIDDQTWQAAKHGYERSIKKAFVLLTRRELESLIHRHFAALNSLIQACLTSREAREVARYFQPGKIDIPWDVVIKIDAPEKGETGKPFLVYIEIQPLFSAYTLRILWRPEPVKSWPRSATSTQLISPSEAGCEPGLELACAHQFSVLVRLKLRCFRPGRQRLGSILVSTGEGAMRREVGLGDIDLVEQYHPVFYRKPYQADLNNFDDFLAQAEAGHLHVVVVVGSGGSGKTRLCEEFGFSAEQRGFRWISRSHPNHQDQPYKIFGDLFRSLVPEPPSEERPGDIVWRYLSGLNPPLATASDSLPGALYPYDRHHSHSSDGVDREILIRVLLTLIVDQSRRHPLCIHISDLHWCSTSALSLIVEAIDRLKELNASSVTRIIFLLEGRVGEALQETAETTEYNHSLAAGWEAFVERVPGQVSRIRPLDESHSREFLRYLFENTESLDRRVPRELIPHQEELIRSILQFGEGNPFHMIEQIKLLRHYGIIKQNTRTGLLFLSQAVPSSLQVPRNVRDLVRKRFAYLQARYPAVAVLVRAVALVSDRITGRLFEQLRGSICPEAQRELITQSEFLSLPQDLMGEVRFRHENYYQTLRELDVPQRDTVVDIYRDWLESQEPSAETLFQRGCVAAQASRPDPGLIRNLFVESWRLLEAQRKYPLSARVLEHLLRLFPDNYQSLAKLAVEDIRAFFQYRSLLAKRITWTGDWEYARRIYMALIAWLEGFFDQRLACGEEIDWENLDYELQSAQVELANVEIPMLYYEEAIERLERALPYIRIAARTSNDLKQRWLGLLVRGLNRLAIAFWFEGALAKALITLRQSLRIAKSSGDTLQVSIQLRDLGTARIHTNAKRGEKMLAKSLGLLADIEHLSRQEYIIAYQKIIAELVGGQRQSAQDCLSCAQKNIALLEEVYMKARREGYVNEEVGSALLAGVCHGLLENSEAIRWFRRSISAAHRAGLLEFLWKGHLNLAQVCVAKDESEWEGAGLHAQQAQNLIDLDLSRRTGARRNTRVQYYILPLAQLMRIWTILGDERGPELANCYPEAIHARGASTKLAGKHSGRRQPLYVSSLDKDFFLMN